MILSATGGAAGARKESMRDPRGNSGSGPGGSIPRRGALAWLLARVGFLLIAAVTVVSAASASSVAGPREAAFVRIPVAFAETPPLREMSLPRAPTVVRPILRRELGMPASVNGRGDPPPAAARPEASAVQGWMGASSMPSPGTSFLGLGKGFTGPQGSFGVHAAPPDTNGDAGPNHYVQWVNTSFAVFDKVGVPLLGPIAGNAIFSSLGGGCATNNDGDPLVLYDPLADRWFLSQFSISSTPYLQCVAVSKTPDPTGAWYTWAFPYDNFNDYGKAGVWPDGYYFMYHEFTGAGSWVGTAVCAMDRIRMVSGDPAATQQCFGPNASYGGLLPSHLNLSGSQLPPAGSPNYFMAFGASGRLLLWPFHVDWQSPASSTFPFSVPKVLAVGAFSELCANSPCVSQSGTADRLDGLGDRLMYRLNYRNLGTSESLVVNHSIVSGTSGGVRWYEIRGPGSASPTVFQQGTYAPDASYRWMGSVNMDRQGNVAVGYSASSSTTFPSIRYAGRLATDAAGTLPQAEVTLTAGGGYQPGTGNRWGDYSSMSVDPVDGCTFWYTNQYQSASGSFSWATRVGSFRFPACTSCQPAQPTASSNSPVPRGGMLTLSTPEVTGATYSWLGPNGFTSSQRSPAIAGATAAAAGLYSVLVTVGGCTSLAGTTSVAVSAGPPAPVVAQTSGTNPSCRGASITLDADAGGTAGYTSFLWSTLATTRTITVAPTVTTTYSVTGTIGGVTSLPGYWTQTVGPQATPVIDAPPAVVPRSTFTASVTSNPGSTYAWNVAGGTVVSGTGTASITVQAAWTSPLTLRVTETNARGCLSAEATASVTVALPPGATAFRVLNPCRVVDTRRTDMPAGLGAPSIGAAGTPDRSLPVTSSPCSIPSTAKAVVVNVTVVGVAGVAVGGHLTLYPGDGAAPQTSTINFRAGQVRANNALLALAADGSGTVRVRNGAAGPLDLVIDVTGYFE